MMPLTIKTMSCTRTLPYWDCGIRSIPLPGCLFFDLGQESPGLSPAHEPCGVVLQCRQRATPGVGSRGVQQVQVQVQVQVICLMVEMID